ncbi:hypothetical protein GCM10011490_11500 [Pseudoclavibacter endophyticus]|uniref:Helicase XPB/Ssl2 N-terminal domain-containing protein n=1 Tax=Pseudoclavibacter endophyticus TaxID=1778590 RepID=A0A6H9WRM6_9MICO|nr:helicase-associated domain-containing protein [Pseudoclavibacter endophyticus]KAB1649425.1 hypothetical protein F8O04_03940 [Pseudoclavibacter endophyticus]GGA62744.1 hypothetical protein GCM10011490_11500 [Pseudoclavibacter endophyticus]
MDGVLPIIRLLRTFNTEQLERLVVLRRVPPRSSSGIVDIAEWLVDPGHVRGSIERLGWRAARRMAMGDPAALDRAQALALAVPGEPGPQLVPAARAAIADVLACATPVSEAPALSLPDAGRDARGAERAQALAALVADLVADFDGGTRAARDGRLGSRLAGVDVRRIAAELQLTPAFVEAVVDDMYRAGVAGPADDAWVPTERGRALERGPRIERWRTMAETWLDRLSVADREAVLGRTDAHGGARTDASSTDRGIDAVTGALELGLLVDGTLTEAGKHLLDDRLDDAAAAIERGLPAEIQQVYVQPDLSIVAPGPLAPEAETRLRTVADLERRGTASTYRLSTASLARAFATGLDEAEITRRLTQLSIVPLPQPVTYLIAEASARHGLIRLRPLGSGTRIQSTDHELLDRLEVDQSLGALRLRRRPDGSLDSLLSPEHAASVLTEARLPVMLEDEHGTPLGPRQPRTAPPPRLTISAAVHRFAVALRDDARRQGDGDESNAWLQQRLERARRAKSVMRIRVTVEGAEPVVMTVIPASMTPRWLRVIDPEADVERTFPLDAIELLDDAP